MPPHLPLARFTISSKLSCSCRAAFPSSTGPIAQLPTAVSCSGHYLYTSTTTSHSHPSSAVSFSTNPFHLKKGAPKAKKTISSPSAEHNPNNKAQTNRDRQIDPYDFSDLEAKIKVQLDWLREGLQKLRSGGRLSTETIEGFQVELKHGLGGEGGQGKKVEQVRLGELATVVPRGGRMIAVMVNEDAHLKPITSAIQASPYSLAPQPDSHNPLQLNVPVPPPTAESRAQSVADAKKDYEKATMGVRDARGGWQKWYRKAEKERLIIRDELEKAHKRMETVVDKGLKSLKEVYDQAVKAMER